jgi:hypothetical protein
MSPDIPLKRNLLANGDHEALFLSFLSRQLEHNLFDRKRLKRDHAPDLLLSELSVQIDGIACLNIFQRYNLKKYYMMILYIKITIKMSKCEHLPPMPSTQTQDVGIDFPNPSLIRFAPKCSPSIDLIALTTLPISEY